MDSFDIKILNCLQENSRQTAEAISDQVGLSPAACQRRIKKLRDDQVIDKEVAVLAPDMIGGRTTFIVRVVLDKGKQSMAAFREHIRRYPEVQQCFYTMGEYDFWLIMTAKSVRAYEQLTFELFFDNPHVQHFDTTVAYSAVKSGLNIPLYEEDGV